MSSASRIAWLLFVMSVLLPFGAVTIAQTASPHKPQEAPRDDVRVGVATGSAFEVASIHPSSGVDRRTWFGMNLDESGRYQASAVSLSFLVSIAYETPPNPAKVDTDHTAPKWTTSDLFDIDARVDEASLNDWARLSFDQRMTIVRPMLQRLLAERFHLNLGVETRITPVYALVQAKGGAHVREVPPPPAANNNSPKAGDRPPPDDAAQGVPGAIVCGEMCVAHAVRITDALGQIAANSRADRMLVDQTGLPGYYDFSFSFPTEKSEFPMHEVETDLGMEFKARSVPVKTFVIHSAERPGID